jgi:hypothetical protein
MKHSPNDPWHHYDIHGLVGMRVLADSPTADQLGTMFACFATDEPVPPDLVVSGRMVPLHEAGNLENDLRYTQDTVELLHDHVQVHRKNDGFGVRGPGEMLTTVVAVLDILAAERNAAMFHAATVAYDGAAIAMPAAGGTGKTSTIAKLLKRPGFSFMGDDWAFMTGQGDQLGYAKPMFIKPHHQPIYPHLFEGRRKPLVPSSMSRPLGRLTTVVHPYMVRKPRLAHLARRWSPEHRMVTAYQALPKADITARAPLAISVFVERYDGARTRLTGCSTDWMVDRMIGNFHIELSRPSRDVFDALSATSIVAFQHHLDRKSSVLHSALKDIPCYLLRVPSALTADEASDDVVTQIRSLIDQHQVGGIFPDIDVTDVDGQIEAAV